MQNRMGWIIAFALLVEAPALVHGASKTRHQSTDTGVGVIDSDSIKVIQRKLGVPETGKINPETQIALQKFQKKNNLAPNAQMNKATLEALGVTPTGSRSKKEK